ncbi:hypothetical protein GCM10020367_37430 [Streptomyces sannanensis]|uniref:Uncharacterized protein n=1 Tax=Streptomyces sannanensis TaxID=285536 RepID=A0ABP6SE62_9ACTN
MSPARAITHPGGRPSAFPGRVSSWVRRGGYGDLLRAPLDEPHEARNSQDASSNDPGSEAWIDGEEGSIDMRFRAWVGAGVEKNEGPP